VPTSIFTRNGDNSKAYRKKYITRSFIISTFDNDEYKCKPTSEKAHLICVVFARQFFCTAVLSMTVREEEDILGKTPHGWILFDKVMVLQSGIQGVPSRRQKSDPMAILC
jgi:hypothetical protein